MRDGTGCTSRHKGIHICLWIGGLVVLFSKSFCDVDTQTYHCWMLFNNSHPMSFRCTVSFLLSSKVVGENVLPSCCFCPSDSNSVGFGVHSMCYMAAHGVHFSSGLCYINNRLSGPKSKKQELMDYLSFQPLATAHLKIKDRRSLSGVFPICF